MHDQEYHFREIQLSEEAWRNMPENAGLSYALKMSRVNAFDQMVVERDLMPIIEDIICNDLTSRQKEVIILYFHDNHTQVCVARHLGITQPTVNQHLKGKRRFGQNIGGAFCRIKKAVDRRVHSKQVLPHQRELLEILNSLLDENISRRKAGELRKALSQLD